MQLNYPTLCPSEFNRSNAPNFEKANREFNNRFINNEFGFPCSVCDRLWFKDDLKLLTEAGMGVLLETGHFSSVERFSVCQTCRKSLKRNLVPNLSTSNGFFYPNYPLGLPPLGPIEERLISPRLPFMQIRRLRFAAGTFPLFA